MSEVPHYHKVVEEAKKFRDGGETTYCLLPELLNDMRASLRTAIEQGHDVQLVFTPSFINDLHTRDVENVLEILKNFADGKESLNQDLPDIFEHLDEALERAGSRGIPMGGFFARKNKLLLPAWVEQVRRCKDALLKEIDTDLLGLFNRPVYDTALVTVERAVEYVDVEPLKILIRRYRSVIKKRRGKK